MLCMFLSPLYRLHTLYRKNIYRVKPETVEKTAVVYRVWWLTLEKGNIDRIPDCIAMEEGNVLQRFLQQLQAWYEEDEWRTV